jgi:hypothetical protein
LALGRHPWPSEAWSRRLTALKAPNTSHML